jgi:methionyl-tRNA formyltransferase
MIKTVLIGNRQNILDVLVKHPKIDIVKIFSIDESIKVTNYLSDCLEIISPHGEGKILRKYLQESDFDLCISAGCPYILPIEVLPRSPIYLNCHPSALPKGRGLHPLNECFFSSHKTGGVTIHYLTEHLDGGNIIEQVSFPITLDLDLTLLYSFIFEIEAELLIKAINTLIVNNMHYAGAPQEGVGTYFSRGIHPIRFNSKETKCDTFLEFVRGYSSPSLGIVLVTEKQNYRVFSAQRIENDFLLKRFEKIVAGDICINSGRVILIKLSDGLVRLNNWNVEL